MFTGKPLGVLTAYLPAPYELMVTTEVSIPLLEGGLLYRGAALDVSRTQDVSIQVTKSILDAAHVQVDNENPGNYHVSIGVPDVLGPASPFPFPPDVYDLQISQLEDDPQQSAGFVTNVQTGARARFTYKDINEPITLGVAAIVVIGVAVIMCAANQLIGVLANRECKKVEVTYGFKFNFRNPLEGDIGCRVKCIGR